MLYGSDFFDFQPSYWGVVQRQDTGFWSLVPRFESWRPSLKMMWR